MDAKETRKLFGLVIYSTEHFQQLKVKQCSKLVVCKGYHLSVEGIRKGYLFCQKRCIK